MTEANLSLHALGGSAVGGEHVECFAWPLLLEFLGDCPGGRLLPVDAGLKFAGRSLSAQVDPFWYSHFQDSREFVPPLPDSDEGIRQKQQEGFEKWKINGPGSIEERDDIGVAISLQEREARLRELEKAPPAAGCAFRLSADGSAKGAEADERPHLEERSPFMPEEEEWTELEVAPLGSRAEPSAHVETDKGRELNPCAVEWVSEEVSKELATDLLSQSCFDQVETGNAGEQQLLNPSPALADSAAQAGTMKEMFERAVQQLAATRGIVQELHPKKKGWSGSSRKKKSRAGSTQQSVASVSVGAGFPQNSMMEVFSRATKRLAPTQSKLPHHSGLPLINSMLPMALNATQVACSVMVLQPTETDEEAEQFVRRQVSLSSARKVEGSSAQAESRAAQLKDDTPVGTKRDYEGQAKHAVATSTSVVDKAPAKPRLGYPNPDRAESFHEPRADRAWNKRRHSRGVRTNLAQGDDDTFHQMCDLADSSLMLSATEAAVAPSVQQTAPFQDVVSVPVEVGPAAAPVPVAGVPLLDIEETALDAYVTPTRPPTAALRQPGAPQRRPTTPLNIAQNFMVEVTAEDETSDVAESAAEENVSVVSATESVENGVDLGGENDDEDTSDIPLGQMGLASSLFKLQEKQAHPQPYVLLQATRRGARVICLCDSGAASFNLMSEAAYSLAAQTDPTRFDSLTYRLHPLQVGGIEEGRSAVQIVGQVMQTLYDPKTGRPIRFITAIMRNACTGDADVIFGNRQFASDRWGALIDFEHLVFTISHLEDGYNWPLVLPIQWTCPVPVRSPEAVVPLPESSSSTDAAQQSASTSEGEGGDVSSPSKISAVRFAEQANPESSQSAQLPVTPHPKKIPAETTEELLRQQFEDQLYVDTLLRDVWRVKKLVQLNGAELTEAVKHFEKLEPEMQSRLMDLVSMYGCRGEQFLCLTCQSLAWTSQEHELFEPDEHLGEDAKNGNAKLDVNCRACHNGPRGPFRPDHYRDHMRAIFNKSLLFNYLDDQQTKASTNQLRFTVSEKRALVNIVREAVTSGDISSEGLMRAISGSSAPVAESEKSAGSAYEGKSKPSFGDLFELALRQVAREDSPVGPKAPGAEVTPSSTSDSIFDESFMDSSTTAALADAQGGSVAAAAKPLPEMPRQLFVPREDEEADVPPAPDEWAAGGGPADFVSQFGSGDGPAAAAVENVIEIEKSRSDF